MDNTIDIHEDSGRYLQEYAQSLENLPSEISYHWAEIKNKYDQAKGPEKRIKAGQQDLNKVHRQWFTQELDKRDKLLKNQPVLIQKIQNDFNKLEDLANERVSLAEQALKLVDRHLSRLQHDLDKHDRDHPELAPPPSVPTTSYTISLGRKSLLISESEDDDNEEEEEEEEEESEEEQEEHQVILEQDHQKMMANRNQKRKKKEEREKDEPLYCFCQQVSYGEMVACDGENCPYEWFHMDCVGLNEPPQGTWFCEDCSAELKKRKHTSITSLTKKMKRKRELHA